MKTYQEVKERRVDLGISQDKLAEMTGLKRLSITHGEQRNSRLSAENAERMEMAFLKYESEMPKKDIPRETKNKTYQQKLLESKNADKKNLIPLYNDVASMGGRKIQANMDGVVAPSEYIDTGDWFTDATAAIRHYGDSMTEYPTGCILALKEVYDKKMLVPGKNYVIETSEYRITKKIQLGGDKKSIRAHSTNDEKYTDGTLIHEPFDVQLELINRIFEVLGCVIKQGGGTLVFSNANK